MTPQEIIEGNKILAEFDGWKDKGVLHPYGRSKFNLYSHPDKFGDLWIEKMKYHSSWDWLMEVVEKIEGTAMAHVCMFNKSCWIEFYGVHNDPCKFSRTDNTFKMNVFLTCVEFVKWHNQNKATETTEPCPNCKETKQPCACMRTNPLTHQITKQ